jgi:hypothetical protein
MNLWMAAVLLGLVFGGVFTLIEIIVGTCVLSKRTGGMLLLIPLHRGLGERQLRSGLAWLEWQRGVFPGVVAAADFDLTEEEMERCRTYCKGSGVVWLDKGKLEKNESLFAKLAAMDYTE